MQQVSRRVKALQVLGVCLTLQGVSAFVPAARPTSRRNWCQARMAARQDGLMARDDALGLASFGGLLIGATVLLKPQTANANVGEGGLPEGVEAFQRLLKAQKEWDKVAQTIADREGKLADEEWVNTQIYLRSQYMTGEDMKRIVRDADKERRNAGNEIAKSFQKYAQELEKPVKAKDYKAFLEEHKKGREYFKSFIDLMTDVPDEL